MYYKYTSVYNIETNTWSDGKNLPTVLANPAYCVNGSEVYLAGGTNTGDTRIRTLTVFNPVTGSYTNKAVMPETITSGAGALCNNKMYVIGGYNGTTKNTNYMYDIATNTWTTKAVLPTSYTAGNSAVTYNNMIYLVGYSYIYAYDTVTNTWTTKAATVIGKRGSAVGLIKGQIYTAGGYGSSFSADTHCYNIATNTWTTKSNLTSSGIRVGAVCKDKLYALSDRYRASSSDGSSYYGYSTEFYIP